MITEQVDIKIIDLSRLIMKKEKNYMGKYNYEEAVKNDVIEYIKTETNIQDYASENQLVNYLNDALWIEDSVTGNASGSYTFNTYEAEENLSHNLDLLHEALRESGVDYEKALESGPEYCDVVIRCYLLPKAIQEAVDELEIGNIIDSASISI